MADNETYIDPFYTSALESEAFGTVPLIGSRSSLPKMEVTGSQILIDWLEGKDLKRLATEETAEYSQ